MNRNRPSWFPQSQRARIGHSLPADIRGLKRSASLSIARIAKIPPWHGVCMQGVACSGTGRSGRDHDRCARDSVPGTLFNVGSVIGAVECFVLLYRLEDWRLAPRRGGLAMSYYHRKENECGRGWLRISLSATAVVALLCLGLNAATATEPADDGSATVGVSGYRPRPAGRDCCQQARPVDDRWRNCCESCGPVRLAT